MIRHRVPALVCALVLVGASPRLSSAQHEAHAGSTHSDADSTVASFIARARAATERYKNQKAATDDGYRPLGPDFPAMGVHWANPELVSSGQFDPSRPGLLTYTNVNGVPTLTGVVYALPLADSEAPPAFPFDRSLWHDHIGSIEEESLLLSHDTQHGPTGGLRLAVLHAWIWIDNPAGTFVTDNWALPFARVGLRAPAGAPAGAVRAISLVGGSLPYYLTLAEQLGSPTDAERQRIETTLARHQVEIADWWRKRGPATEASAADVTALAQMWTAMWTEVERSVSPETAARLRRIWQ